MAALRKWLVAGLLVVVPVAITLAVLNWIVGTLDQTLLILPQAWHPDRLIGFHIPGFGVLLTLAILLLVGGVASNFVGKKLVMKRMMTRARGRSGRIEKPFSSLRIIVRERAERIEKEAA